MGRLQTFQQVNVLLDGLPSIHHLSPHIRKIFCEPIELVLDLIGELTSVTKDEGRDWFRVFWQLMKNCQDENCSLSHTGLGLTKHIHAYHCLRNALLLNL